MLSEHRKTHKTTTTPFFLMLVELFWLQVGHGDAYIRATDSHASPSCLVHSNNAKPFPSYTPPPSKSALSVGRLLPIAYD